MNSEQLNFIYEKVIELFNAGSDICSEKNNSCTKYEFGFDNDGNICLIDEIHTPDSSRFWMKILMINIYLIKLKIKL